MKKFRNDIVSVLLLAAGLFVALSLASYNPYDPSFNSIGHGLKATNYCGLFGSFLADTLYQFFGLTAWFFVLGCLRASYLSFQGEETSWRDLRGVWGGLLIITVSSLISVYLPTMKIFAGQIFLGGLLGLGISQTLVRGFNSVGVQVILWSSAILLTVFYSEKTLQELMKGPRVLIAKIGKFKWSSLFVYLPRKEKKVAVTKEPKEPQVAAFEIQSEQTPKRIVPPVQMNLQRNPPEEGEEQEDDDLVTPFEPPRRKVAIKTKLPRKVANWEMPKFSMLEDPPVSRIKLDEREIKRKAETLLDKLGQFDVNGQISSIKTGPAVTMFEFKPNADVRVNKVTELADDLSLALSAESLRIIAPIPGRDVIGIETSNSQRETVYLKDILADESFWSEDFKLPIALGKQTNGEPKIVDLRKMPHLLIAGTTGSGKSVFTVSTLTGFLFKHSPKTLRLILVDPKQVDLAAFTDIPHLIMPPIRDPKKAVFALRWAVKEMEKRYNSMKVMGGSRNIEQYNEFCEKLTPEQLAEHEKINQELDSEPGRKKDQYYFTPQPYIVIVVEEFGDVMSVDKQNVEQNVVRLAQMARACGIHLMLAMQSPRKEVVTGLIKTNIPGRISFKVASKMDSRIILDEQGAERLLAQGDMLFLTGGISKPIRHHGPFLKETEINMVAKFWSDQGQPEFDPIVLRAIEGGSVDGESDFAGASSGGGSFGDDEHDEKYDEILAWASEQKEVSASLIQRRFRLGYPRAARLIELFEREGVVGPANGSKPRQVLISSYNKEVE